VLHVIRVQAHPAAPVLAAQASRWSWRASSSRCARGRRCARPPRSCLSSWATLPSTRWASSARRGFAGSACTVVSGSKRQLGDFAFFTLGEFCQARFCWERLPSSAWFQEAARRLCLLHAGRVLPGAVLLGALAQQCLVSRGSWATLPSSRWASSARRGFAGSACPAVPIMKSAGPCWEERSTRCTCASHIMGLLCCARQAFYKVVRHILRDDGRGAVAGALLFCVRKLAARMHAADCMQKPPRLEPADPADD
jgi:hypothetical protein